MACCLNAIEEESHAFSRADSGTVLKGGEHLQALTYLLHEGLPLTAM